VRELERVADLGVLLGVAMIVHATNSPLGLPPNPGMAEFHRNRLPASLQYLDQVLADGRPFVAGEHPSIADCTLAAGLQLGRFGKVELDPAYAHLARWDRAYRERPPARSVLNV
jgi:glutathione S-transferase